MTGNLKYLKNLLLRENLKEQVPEQLRNKSIQRKLNHNQATDLETLQLDEETEV